MRKRVDLVNFILIPAVISELISVLFSDILPHGERKTQRRSIDVEGFRRQMARNW